MKNFEKFFNKINWKLVLPITGICMIAIIALFAVFVLPKIELKEIGKTIIESETNQAKSVEISLESANKENYAPLQEEQLPVETVVKAVASGKCGTSSDASKWTLNSAGKLTIGNGKLDNINGYTDNRPWKDYINDIKSVNFQTNVIANEKLRGLFYKCKNLETVDFGGLDTLNTKDMYAMFNDCSKLKSINFGTEFKTKNVINMRYMFANCPKLKSINFDKNFRTDKVTDMRGMFRGSSSLTELDLSSFNTENVTTMYAMFTNCRNLKKLDIRNFSSKNLINSISANGAEITTVTFGNNYSIDDSAVPDSDYFNFFLPEGLWKAGNKIYSTYQIYERVWKGKAGSGGKDDYLTYERISSVTNEFDYKYTYNLYNKNQLLIIDKRKTYNRQYDYYLK